MSALPRPASLAAKHPGARTLLRRLASLEGALLLREGEHIWLAAEPDRVVQVPAGGAFLEALASILEDATGEVLWALALTYEAGRALHPGGDGGLREDPDLPRLCALRYPAWARIGPDGLHLHGAVSERARLAATLARPEDAPPAGKGIGAIERDLDDDAYAERFAAVQASLQAGQTYQVNLTTAHRFTWEGSPLALFERLSGDSLPARALYLDAGAVVIASASPELLLDYDPVTRLARSAPIKGTCPASGDPAERARLARRLRADPKERAEHVMIVDLVRHDLSQVCTPGTVRPRRLFDLLRSGPVQHLVTTVEGRLAEDRTPLDLLAALLPGGSVTGAPKVAAMQLIDALEVAPRGFYCGAIGRAGPRGALSLTLPIRTATLRPSGRRGRFSGTYPTGGGIVIDSCLAGELDEVHLKAARLRRALT